MSNIHPVVDDTDSDDKMGWWVENLREEEESMVKPNDLQLLQLSCSIRRRGVNPQPVQQVDAHTQHVKRGLWTHLPTIVSLPIM